jgi:predicted metal-dependent TIM-barrel fold hydrolase
LAPKWVLHRPTSEGPVTTSASVPAVDPSEIALHYILVDHTHAEQITHPAKLGCALGINVIAIELRLLFLITLTPVGMGNL